MPDGRQDNEGHYYGQFAAAFVRGKMAAGVPLVLPRELFARPLEDLSDTELALVVRVGLDGGLRLHKFKRTIPLRRVNRVLGAIRGLYPEDLLDVGSGRGAFLWPLLDAFPELPVTSIDRDAQRAEDLGWVRAGGIARLRPVRADATRMPFADGAFDGVTFLEVLEHIPDAQAALAEAARVARRFLVVTVPSKEDDNPEHIHLFTAASLGEMFQRAGVRRVNFDYVPGHIVAVASTPGGTR